MMANEAAAGGSDPVTQTTQNIFAALFQAGAVLALLVLSALSLQAEENDRMQVGEVCAIGGTAKVIHVFASDDTTAETGMKVFIGDIVETGDKGSVELILGLNRRLRLGGNSSIKLLFMRDKTTEKDTEIIYSQSLVIALRKGEARIRVRQNLITPTPVIMRIGNVQANLPRSDFIVRRKLNGASHLEKCEFSVCWGRAELTLKSVGEKDWNPELVQEIIAPAEGISPLEPVASDKIEWKKVPLEQVQQYTETLPFSIDQMETAPGDTPVKQDPLPGA